MPGLRTRESRGTPGTALGTSPAATIEATVPCGLEDVAEREIRQRFGRQVQIDGVQQGAILFHYWGALPALLHLRTIASPYLIVPFAIPRPRGLLGDEHLRRLAQEIRSVMAMHPPGSFIHGHLSAAGADSPVMRRLSAAISAATGLPMGGDEGNLQLRIRRGHAEAGWEALIRLAPRPLSARPWRVCDMPGALNAAVAAAMVMLVEPAAGELFLNPACGSGTILIECAGMQPGARIIGCDIAGEALTCARANVAASGLTRVIELENWDARHLPLAAGSVQAVCVDLPFGRAVGSHAANRELYTDVLGEIARCARVGARCCILTHQGGMVDEILTHMRSWLVERRTRVHLGGLIPTLFLLERRSR